MPSLKEVIQEMFSAIGSSISPNAAKQIAQIVEADVSDAGEMPADAEHDNVTTLENEDDIYGEEPSDDREEQRDIDDIVDQIDMAKDDLEDLLFDLEDVQDDLLDIGDLGGGEPGMDAGGDDDDLGLEQEPGEGEPKSTDDDFDEL
jgi:hypothetical protein